MTKKITLSIETAFEGGSLSIDDGERELAGWVGSGKISKAEEILEQISRLQSEGKFKKNELRVIYVSRDYGSSTGIKIGAAIAKGLGKSLGCRVVEQSLLESLAHFYRRLTEREMLIALPVGKTRICFQHFDADAFSREVKIAEREVFSLQLHSNKKRALILSQNLYDGFGSDFDDFDGSVTLFNAGSNLAKFLKF